MNDDSTLPEPSGTEEEQAQQEGAERLRRLRVWLAGTLDGGPRLDDAVKEWREGMAIYHIDPEERADEDEHLSAESLVNRTEEQLAEIRQRIRDRRELGSEPSTPITKEESELRYAQVIESLRADCAEGREPSPMHLVLAARYVEGKLDLHGYRQALLSL